MRDTKTRSRPQIQPLEPRLMLDGSTVLVHEFADDRNVGTIAATDDKIVFSLWDDGAAEGERELWSSDGTAAGMVQLRPGDVCPIRPPSGERYPEIRGEVFFVDSCLDYQVLMKTDGTEAGTVVVGTSEDDEYFWDVEILGANNNLLYFAGSYLDDGREGIWSSDGTWEGTHLLHEFSFVKRPNNDTLVGGLRGHMVDEGGLVFAIESLEGIDLFVSDTNRDVEYLSALPMRSTRQIVRMDDRPDEHFVVAGSGTDDDFAYWRTDGTAEGTSILDTGTDVPDGLPPFYNLLSEVGDFSYFTNAPFVGVGEGNLWRTDLTTLETELVSDAVQPYVDHGITISEEIDGKLYFAGFTEENGHQLWRSDGTQQGTVRLTNLEGSSAPKYLTELNGQLYFRAWEGPSIWRIPLDPLPGDADENGEVNFADFLTLSANFGRDDQVVFADGDFDDNGIVDFADFLILSGNFGAKAVEDV